MNINDFDKTFCEKYLELITGEFKNLNLTRIMEFEEFYEKQYVDSLLPFNKIQYLNEILEERQLHLDVGFGGGFPLLPLAYNYSDSIFLGFEARGKKANAVNEIAERIDLENVACFHKRIEEVLIDRSCLMSFKAVAKIKDLIDKVNLDEDSEVDLLFYKGPSVYEQESVPNTYKSFKLKEKIEVKLGENTRILFVYSSKVPRGTGARRKFPGGSFEASGGKKQRDLIKKKKNLVKLSQILHT